jgi:hypothetical protein
MLDLLKNSVWTLRFSVALAAVLMLFMLVRCSSLINPPIPPARTAVTAFFDLLKAGDYDTAKKSIFLVPKPLFGAFGLLRDMNASSGGRWNWAAQNYTISTFEQQGDQATVTVQTLATSLDPATSGSSLPSVSYSNTLEMTYSREEKIWKFVANANLVQTLLGGQLSSLQSLGAGQ